MLVPNITRQDTCITFFCSGCLFKLNPLPFAERTLILPYDFVRNCKLKIKTIVIVVLIFLKKKYGGYQSFLWGPRYHCFCTCGDICPGFQSQGGFPHLYASSPTHNGFLRFTSGATPADLLTASLVGEPFRSTYFGTSTVVLIFN